MRELGVVFVSLALVASVACTNDAGTGETDSGTETGESETDTGTETDAGTETGTETGTEPDREALVAELSERGPYEVGFKTLELSYAPPGAPEDEARVVPVLVWYPAIDDSGAPPATYEVAGIVQLPTPDVLDGPEVSADGPFPVAVYSHGSGGEGLLAYPFAERFASHGWVMYSPGHTGNTALDSVGGTESSLFENAVNRPSDISAVLDRVDAGFDGESVAAASDLSQVFVFGHSFGAYTTLAIGGATLDYEALLASCAGADCDYLMDPEVADAFADGFGDPRVNAIAPQAPALVPSFGAGEIAGIDVPTMLQSGKLDITTPDATQAQPTWDALDEPGDIWIDLPFGAHYSFITICDDLDPSLLEVFVPSNAEDGCGMQFTPTSEIVPVLNTYLLAFARLEVLGETQWSVVLDGEPLHAEVDVSRK